MDTGRNSDSDVKSNVHKEFQFLRTIVDRSVLLIFPLHVFFSWARTWISENRLDTPVYLAYFSGTTRAGNSRRKKKPNKQTIDLEKKAENGSIQLNQVPTSGPQPDSEACEEVPVPTHQAAGFGPGTDQAALPLPAGAQSAPALHLVHHLEPGHVVVPGGWRGHVTLFLAEVQVGPSWSEKK